MAPVLLAYSDLELSVRPGALKARVGDEVPIDITLRNRGPDAAEEVPVRVMIPHDLLVASDEATSGAFDRASGFWISGEILPGASASLTLVVTPEAVGFGLLQIQAAILGRSGDDPTPQDHIATAPLLVEGDGTADLRIVRVEAPRTAIRGQTVPFEIELAARGPDPPAGILLSLELPPGMTAPASAEIDGLVSIFRGDGSGGLKRTGFRFPGNGAAAIALADADADGRADLIAANSRDGDVSVFPGDGQGGFGARRRFRAGDGPAAILVADLDGDARPDLVTRNEISGDLSVLLGRGSGNFRSKRRLRTLAAPDAIAVADLEGDGRPDIVIGYVSDRLITAMPGAGGGRFGEEIKLVNAVPNVLRTPDLDGDRLPELVTAESERDLVWVFLNRGNRRFQAVQQAQVGNRPEDLIEGDFDRDGFPDLVAINTGSQDLSVLLGHGIGTFKVERRIPLGGLPVGPAAAADVDGDGNPDIILATPGLPESPASEIKVFPGNGDGTFQPARENDLGAFITFSATSIAAADLDGDGIADLAACGRETLRCTLPSPSEAICPLVGFSLAGSGNGLTVTFRPRVSGPLPNSGSTGTYRIAIEAIPRDKRRGNNAATGKIKLTHPPPRGRPPGGPRR